MKRPPAGISDERVERAARLASSELGCRCVLLEGRDGGVVVVNANRGELECARAVPLPPGEDTVGVARPEQRAALATVAVVRVTRSDQETAYVRFGWADAPADGIDETRISDWAETVVDIVDAEAYRDRSLAIADLVPHALVIEVPGKRRVLTNDAFEDYLAQASESGLSSLRDIIDINPEDLVLGETRNETRTVEIGGEQRVFDVAMRLYRDWTDKNDAIMAVMTDLTEIQQSEEELRLKQRQVEAANTELERSNQELEQFAYVASHDLQEPLRMVSSFLSLLVEEYGEGLDDEAREYVGFAVDGALRMKSMVNELLAFSRIRSREEPVEVVDFEKVVADAIDEIHQNYPTADITFSVGALPTLPARPGQLRRVFANLFVNALKHGGRDDVHLGIRAEEHAGDWEIAVIDNGMGVPDQQKNRIFDIFVRGSRGEHHSGSGIGLAVCATVVARHGGRIWVEDADEGGAAFKFTISKEIDDGDR
jgi:signal transduction histidine kinase